MQLIDTKYPKKEKLKSRKSIETLFKEGKWVTNFPLKMIYLQTEFDDSLMKIGVSVSKKNFKRAVDRNRIKRLLREVYRLNKSLLLTKFDKSVAVMLIYNDKEMRSFEQIQKEYFKLIEKINK